MTRREKVLAIAVAGILGVAGAGFGVRAVMLKPLREIDKRIAASREKLDKVKAERRTYFSDEEKIKALAQRSFSQDVDEASAKSGEMLTRLILQSGLKESDFTRLPVGPRKLRGASEIGWSVQGDGPLANVINLLFLLHESAYVNQIENLSISTGDSPGLVRVRFRYVTLVLTPAPVVEPIDLAPNYTLESPERHIYDGIVARDILRPYIKRAPPSPVPGTAASAGSSTPGAPAGGPESFRIVSLSEWQGQPEVHVRDLTQQKTLRFRPGDPLAGGVIVMVDYRARPVPGNEALQSFSRVIVRIGTEYWAIERGRTLAEKYQLKPEQLPEDLAKAASP